MIQYIISLLIIGVIFGYFRLYSRPKTAIEWYATTIQALGYKVKLFPFQFFGCPVFTDFQDSEKKYNDAMYSWKHDLHQYDVLVYNTLATPTVEFLNPELVKNFYLPDNVYVHHKMPFLISNIQRSLGHGIAFSEDKEWKRKRTIMNAVFNYDFIIENIPKINRISRDSLNLMEAECQAKGKMETLPTSTKYKINPCELFASMFSNVMLECFFGTVSIHEKINGQSISAFINCLNSDINKQTFQIPSLLFGTKFLSLGLREKDRDINRRIQLLRKLAKEMIKKRLEELQKSGPREKYQDIIQALVLRKNLSQEKTKISSKSLEYDYMQLIEQFCTFFTAGTDTSSHFTQMMVYYISRNKQIEKKLRSQIDQFITCEEDITRENLKKLTYIDWIQNETTRHYGPGNGIFTRIAQKDHYIGTIPIMKGCAVSIQPMGSHFNDKYYRNPLEFRPERWEKECEGNHPFALGGFSGGPRTCIGKHLAHLESKIALVHFMRRYKQLKLPKQDMKMQAKFLYQAEYLQLQLTK